MAGVALDDVDEVGDEVGAALVVILYLSPGRIDLLLRAYEAVILRYPPEEDEDSHDGCDDSF